MECRCNGRTIQRWRDGDPHIAWPTGSKRLFYVILQDGKGLAPWSLAQCKEGQRLSHSAWPAPPSQGPTTPLKWYPVANGDGHRDLRYAGSRLLLQGRTPLARDQTPLLFYTIRELLPEHSRQDLECISLAVFTDLLVFNDGEQLLNKLHTAEYREERDWSTLRLTRSRNDLHQWQ